MPWVQDRNTAEYKAFLAGLKVGDVVGLPTPNRYGDLRKWWPLLRRARIVRFTPKQIVLANDWRAVRETGALVGLAFEYLHPWAAADQAAEDAYRLRLDLMHRVDRLTATLSNEAVAAVLGIIVKDDEKRAKT